MPLCSADISWGQLQGGLSKLNGLGRKKQSHPPVGTRSRGLEGNELAKKGASAPLVESESCCGLGDGFIIGEIRCEVEAIRSDSWKDTRGTETSQGTTERL